MSQSLKRDELNIEAGKPVRRAYIKVTEAKRRSLIELMEKERLNIKAASARLNINYSSAKHIVKLFKREKRLVSFAKESKVNRETSIEIIKADLINDCGTLSRTPESISTNLPPLVFFFEANQIAPTFDFSLYTPVIYER